MPEPSVTVDPSCVALDPPMVGVPLIVTAGMGVTSTPIAVQSNVDPDRVQVELNAALELELS
jgi:hypothetical protein